MTDTVPPAQALTWPRARVLLRSGLAVLVITVLAAALSACGASTALGNAFLAPLSALSATDVVLETNLESAVEGGIAQAGIPGSSGGLTTTGPPSTPGVVSIASATDVSIYTAFNPADRHCLGTFVIAAGAPFAVLGETRPGTYDFWFGPTSVAHCTASIFTTEAQVPSGWATGDPSTSWPNS